MTIDRLPFTFHHLPLTIYPSLFTFHFSPFTIYHLPFTHSPITISPFTMIIVSLRTAARSSSSNSSHNHEVTKVTNHRVYHCTLPTYSTLLYSTPLHYSEKAALLYGNFGKVKTRREGRGGFAWDARYCCFYLCSSLSHLAVSDLGDTGLLQSRSRVFGAGLSGEGSLVVRAFFGSVGQSHYIWGGGFSLACGF